MPYDEDPYWGGFSKTKPKVAKEMPSNQSNSTMAQRSLPDWSQVRGKPKGHDSAPNPSPLLVEWLAKRGMVVK